MNLACLHAFLVALLFRLRLQMHGILVFEPCDFVLSRNLSLGRDYIGSTRMCMALSRVLQRMMWTWRIRPVFVGRRTLGPAYRNHRQCCTNCGCRLFHGHDLPPNCAILSRFRLPSVQPRAGSAEERIRSAAATSTSTTSSISFAVRG